MHSPTEKCLKAIYRILRFHKRVPSKGLLFGKRVMYKPTLILVRGSDENSKLTYGLLEETYCHG